jgi:hypothetical protein
MDLTEREMFRVPSTYFFIVGAAENPRVRVDRLTKRVAEFSCILNQFVRMVPTKGHPDHREDLRLLSFGGTPVTENTLRTKGFEELKDSLKEAKPSRCRLYERVFGDGNYALTSVKDEVYRYQAHVMKDKNSGVTVPLDWDSIEGGENQSMGGQRGHDS